MALIVEVQQNYVAKAERKYTEFVPAVVVAKADANYVVIDTQTQLAPTELTLTRLGDDLQITRGTDEVFIKNYFLYENSALIGPIGASTYAVYQETSFSLLNWMGLTDGLSMRRGETAQAQLSDDTLEAAWLGTENSSSAFSSLLVPVLTSLAATVVGFFAIKQADQSDDDSSDSSSSLRAPSALVVSDDGTTVTGEGSPGSRVQVFDGAGNQLGSGSVSALGTFSAVLAVPQNAGQTLSVQATSGGNESSSVQLTAPIGQNGPVSQPVDLDSSANSIDENSPVGTEVGITVQASDFEAITYTLSDDAQGAFAIDPVTGVVSSAQELDFEAAAQYAITARATAGDSFRETNLAISVNNLNDNAITEVIDADAAENQIDATEAVGSLVGITALAVDPDGSEQISYELLESADGRFSIDATDGEIITARDLSQDDGVFDVQVQAFSSDGTATQAVFSIEVIADTSASAAAVI